MSFLKRLGFYLIGLSIGLVFLAFFLSRKNAEFCYLPNCRVLKELRSKPLQYSPEIAESIQNQQVDSLEIQEFLKEGDVRFKLSDTGSKPCPTYVIAHKIRDRETELLVRNCDSTVIAWRLSSPE